MELDGSVYSVDSLNSYAELHFDTVKITDDDVTTPFVIIAEPIVILYALPQGGV